MVRRPKKAFWERGYNRSHCLWQGKDKLARVQLDVNTRLKYVWQAAGRTGEAATLSSAKAAAEFAVLLADRQLLLFEPDESPLPPA